MCTKVGVWTSEAESLIASDEESGLAESGSLAASMATADGDVADSDPSSSSDVRRDKC